MDNVIIYDRETDTLYVSESDGFGWLGLLFVLATPLFIIGAWLKQYAVFVSENMQLTVLLFLGFCVLVGLLLYGKRRVAHKRWGIIAVVISILPIGFGQAFYAVPYILSHEDAFAVSFEWMIVTFFTVGISFFVIQISMLFKNGLTHLLIAGVYLIAALFVFL